MPILIAQTWERGWQKVVFIPRFQVSFETQKQHVYFAFALLICIFLSFMFVHDKMLSNQQFFDRGVQRTF